MLQYHEVVGVGVSSLQVAAFALKTGHASYPAIMVAVVVDERYDVKRKNIESGEPWERA